MRQSFRVYGLILFFLTSLSPALRAADRLDHVPGRLLVSSRRSADAGQVANALRRQGAVVRRQMGALHVNVVDVPESSSDAIAAALRKSGLFEYVERDSYAHTASSGTVIPNDPDYSLQWYLPQIQAPQAWGVTTGVVPVAVIDSGIDGTHPDLAAKLLPGWNFVNNNSITTDVLGHGTAVAGTLAAISNNNTGVTGVSWGSRILPLVVVDANDYASYSNIAAAIQYAADQGVRIINVSVGGTTPSATLQNAVNYAWNNGSIVFASAMNDSSSTPNYPAACANAVAVSATDNNDSLASFSNYGNWITVAAPGLNILTTTMGDGYGYWYGTSFSAPITAGIGALILSVNPSLTASQVVNIIEQSADLVGGATGFTASFGWGRVDARRAVGAAQQTVVPVTVAVTPSTASLSAGQTVQLTASVTGTTNPAAWSWSPSIGTIAGGLYTAPASITAAQTITVTATVAGVSASAVVTLTPPAIAAPVFTPLLVNAGGPNYVDSAGGMWMADTGYADGYTWGVSNAITNTGAPALYQTCRYGPAFNYLFSVPNGSYNVTLKFAEPYFSTPGQRMFNVAINGASALANFDIYAQAGGAFIALDRTFPVTVTNGQINLQFTSGAADMPLVNALAVTQTSSASGSGAGTPAASAILVNAGGGAYTDPSGQSWAADTGFTGGDLWMASNPIANTAAQPLYQTCRYGNFAYNFAVPNGNYTVTLKFAEIYMTGPGERLFNVAINGAAVLTNFDIFAQAGGIFAALDESFPITVTNGQITIQFTPGAANLPLVNAIEITP